MDLIFGPSGLDLVMGQSARRTSAMPLKSEDSTVIPRWLWAGIGILLLATIGGLGSLATWTLINVVNGATADQVHDVRLSQLETQYSDIRQAQGDMMTKLHGIELNGRKLEDLIEKMDAALEALSK